MFYKKEGENYFEAETVCLPNGKILTTENRENKDGWIWYDKQPQDFIDFQNNELNKHVIK
jgi:hypothetical protein